LDYFATDGICWNEECGLILLFGPALKP